MTGVLELREELDEALRKDRRGDALALYEEIEALEPAEPRWPHRRGDLLSKLGSKKEAVNAYERAVDLYVEQGFVARAVAMAKVILEVDPGRDDVLQRIDPEEARRLHRNQRRPSTRPVPLDRPDEPRRPLSPDPFAPLTPAADAMDDEVRFEDTDAIELDLSELDVVVEEVEDSGKPSVPQGAAPPPPLPPGAGAQPPSLPSEALEMSPEAADPFGPTGVEAPPSGVSNPSEWETAEHLTDDDEGSPEEPLTSAGAEAAASSSTAELAERLAPPNAGSRPPSRMPFDPDQGSESDIQTRDVPADDDEVPAAAHAVAFELDEREFGREDDLANPAEAWAEAETTQTDSSEGGLTPAQLARLPGVPVFAELTRETLVELSRRSELVRASPKERLVEVGDEADALFVIVEGRVAVRLPGAPPEAPPVALLGEGEVFGEACLLDDATRQANIDAQSAVLALKIPKEVLDDLVVSYPPLGDILLELFTRRAVSNLVLVSELFATLDPEMRREMVKLFEARRAEAGQTIVEEGKRSDALYILLAGSLLVRSSDSVQNLEPLAMFGQASLLSHEPAEATITSMSDALLLRLPAARFAELAALYPTVLMTLSELASRPGIGDIALQPLG